MKTQKKRELYTGLTTAQAEESRRTKGENTFAASVSAGFWRCFFENLKDPVIKILLFALAVDLFLAFRGGDWIETCGIAVSVFLATFISTVSERGSESAFRRLKEVCDRGEVRVRRDGRVCRLPIEQLVVGDVVLLSAGEQIPADAFLVSGSLVVDQAMLTGESREIEKLPSADKTKLPTSKSAVFRGSVILQGEGEVEIYAVGEQTFLGRISREVTLATRQSPLKLRLSRLARQISIFGYIAAFFISITYLLDTFLIDSGFEYAIFLQKINDTQYLLSHLLHALMLGLTVIVMAVPEGLPMMIAVVLSSNIRRMIKDNVLVRKPVGIEAAGSMNLLFTDKTGTLTCGTMSVSSLLCADLLECAPADIKKHSPTVGLMYSLCSVFNTSNDFAQSRLVCGNPTDRALQESILLGDSLDKSIFEDYHVIGRIPFDSRTKYSAVALSGRGKTVIIKGAPDILLPACRRAYIGETRRDIKPYLYRLSEQIRALSAQGKRLLCIAEGESLPEGRSTGVLTLCCIVVLEDPVRPQAASSVACLRSAGIQTVMITGDGKETAVSIAKKCGIITCERGVVLSGEELSALDDEEIARLMPHLALVCRALPDDKSRLVRISQEMGLVVGMTGDGINDAPALKRADIGFALGCGTSVAKDAGDIIILDNDLSSIAKAVLYGRTIFKSIRKFITLQLTMNLCAVGISMIGPFVGVDSPVTVVQMLWINIIMDTLGGLAFAGEAPLPSYMKEPPKRRDEPILNRYMVCQIVLSGIFTVALFLFFLLSPYTRSAFRPDPESIYLLSAFFALFIFTSILQCFNCRTDRLRLFSGITKNRAFILIITLIFIIQIGFIYLGGEVLRTAPLTAKELRFTLLPALLVIPADLVRKLVLRLFCRSSGF